MRKLRAFLASVLRFLYLTPLREAFIGLREASPGVRVLGWLGYLGVASLLATMIISAIPGVNLPSIIFVTSAGPKGEASLTHIPRLAILAGLMGLCLGWTYLLTGAVRGKPLIFLPLALLFCAQQACLLTIALNAGSRWAVLACVLLPILLMLVMLYLLTYRQAFWHKYLLPEFGVSLLLVSIAALFLWPGEEDLFEITSGLNAVFSLLFVLLVPIWLLFGLSVVDMGLDIASRVVLALRRRLSAPMFHALTFILLLSRPTALLIWYVSSLFIPPAEGNAGLLASGVFLDAVLAVPLLAALIMVIVARRWDGYRAAKFLAISLAFLVFSVGLALAMGGIDLSNPLELTVQGIGVLPSVLVFVVMLVYDIFDLGAKFVRRESRWISREGRILLMFGLALLATGLMIFMVNLRDEEGNLLIHWDTDFGNFFALGLLVLGFPYLLWTIWKRGDRLVGARAEFESVAPSGVAFSAAMARRPAFLIVAIALATLLFGGLLAVLMR